MVSKTIQIEESEYNCGGVIVTLWRDDEGDDGVLFIAWHEWEEGPTLQTDFVPMSYNLAQSFIRDFSSVSAQDYVDSFQP